MVRQIQGGTADQVRATKLMKAQAAFQGAPTAVSAISSFLLVMVMALPVSKKYSKK